MLFAAISRSTAEHYVWGEVCDGWRLVSSPELSVIEERMPPGASEVPHRHSRARQFFYLLAGSLLMEVDGFAHHLHPGEGIEIPPRVAHLVRTGDQEARFLVISQPSTEGDRELLADG